MRMRGKGRPTHLVSRNKRIRLWHRRLANVSNARVVRASKLVDGIDIGLKEYDPAEVFIDSDDSEVSSDDESPPNSASQSALLEPVPSSIETMIPNVDSVLQTKENDDDGIAKLCTPCVCSKSTQVVRHNKSMTPTTNKLEEVHADLWGPHDPPSQSGSVYAAIIMCEHTCKTWTLYLRGKDDFVDAF